MSCNKTNSEKKGKNCKQMSLIIKHCMEAMIVSIRVPVFKERGRIRATGTCRKTKIYLTTVIVVVMGYLIFFTSRLWYPGQKDAEDYTPIGQMQEIKETGNGVTIVYWAYSPEQSAMSVELDINAVDRDISFAAVDKKRRELPVTLKLSQSGTYVLKLDSIQEDFQAVSLRVTIQGKTIRLYTNNKQIDKVEKRHFYSDFGGYYQARVSRNIFVTGTRNSRDKRTNSKLARADRVL